MLGRIQIFNNWSEYLSDNKNISLGLEYFCNEGDNLWNMKDKDFINLAINEIESIGLIDKKNVVDTNIVRVKKAYPAYFDAYKDIDQVIEYLNKIDNLYFIGRNGQHRYNNMDHSMLTETYASDNIINNVKDKSNIWNVNIEKDYLEVKDEKINK